MESDKALDSDNNLGNGQRREELCADSVTSGFSL